jgi:hypothetical protein
LLQWVRVLSRLAAGHAERSPFAQMTRGQTVEVKLGRRFPVELDGGARPAVAKLSASVEPGSIVVCVPEAKP